MQQQLRNTRIWMPLYSYYTSINVEMKYNFIFSWISIVMNYCKKNKAMFKKT